MPQHPSNTVSRPALLALGLVALLTSSGAWSAKRQAVLAGFEPDLIADSIELVDQRPEEEKTASMGSLVITSCNYAVRRIADDVSSPDRMTLLRSDLAAALGGAIAGKKVVVKHYGLYINDGPRLRRGALNNFTGLIPDIARETGNCPPEKMNGGWFDRMKYTGEFSPVIAELTVQVDGRTYVANGLISPEKHYINNAKDQYFGELVFKALRKTTEDLMTKLQPGYVATSSN